MSDLHKLFSLGTCEYPAPTVQGRVLMQTEPSSLCPAWVSLLPAAPCLASGRPSLVLLVSRWGWTVFWLYAPPPCPVCSQTLSLEASERWWELGLQVPVSSDPRASLWLSTYGIVVEHPRLKVSICKNPEKYIWVDTRGTWLMFPTGDLFKWCCPGFLQSTKVEGNGST